MGGSARSQHACGGGHPTGPQGGLDASVTGARAERGYPPRITPLSPLNTGRGVIVTLRAMSMRRVAVIAALAMLALAVPLTAVAAPAPEPPATPLSAYRVPGVTTPTARAMVARQGVDVLGGGRDYLEVRATPAQAGRLRAGGLRLVPLPAVAPVPGLVAPVPASSRSGTGVITPTASSPLSWTRWPRRTPTRWRCPATAGRRRAVHCRW